MEAASSSLSVAACRVSLRALSRVDDQVPAALSIVLDTMPRWGIIPDIACINAVLELCERTGEGVDGAVEVLQCAMRRDGGLDLSAVALGRNVGAALPITWRAESVERLGPRAD